MFKKAAILLPVLFTGIILLIFNCRQYIDPHQTSMPMPRETMVIDREEHHHLKYEWIEQMHRAAPGDNWRKMDLDYRLERAQERKEGSVSENGSVYGKWKELGSNNQAGRTLVAEYDSVNGIVYVASDGGQLWKGNIGMDNWVSLTDPVKINGIHFLRKIDMNGTSRLLVGSSMWNVPGFFWSDDEGRTWQTASGLENVVSWGYVRRAVMKPDPAEGIYLVTLEWDYVHWNAVAGIYASWDYGETFSKLFTLSYSADKVDLWTNRYANGDVFMLAKEKFYTIDDNGNQVLIGELGSPEPDFVILTGANTFYTNQFYGLLRYNNLSNFYSSPDGGATWQMKSSTEEGPFMINSLVASPTQAGMLYFGGINAYRSFDHGQTWDLINQWYEYYGSPEDKLHADIPAFNPFINTQGDEFTFINTDGGLYISYDHLENVQNLSLNNLRISQYYSTYTCRFDPQYSHAGSQDQGYQFSEQQGDTSVISFDQLISGDYGNIVSGDGGASVWMVYPGFAMYCPDINHSVNFKFWDFIGGNFQWLPYLMADPADPASVYLAGGGTNGGAHIYHLSYHSGQFSYAVEDFDFSNGTNANISAMAVSPIDSQLRYVLTSESDFFYSPDGGTTWTQTQGFNGPGSHYFYGATIVPSNLTAGLVYVGGSGYSNDPVYVSDDHGISFRPMAAGLPSTLVFRMTLSDDDSLLFAATEVGAFVCKTTEEQWYDLNDSILPDQSYWSVDWVPALKKARFASYGRGVWEFDTDPQVEAGFAASQTVIGEGETILFTDLSQWNPVNWEWHFEGGTPEVSYEQNPGDITYDETGLYDVQLIVKNHNSTDTLTRNDYIEVLPPVGIKRPVPPSQVVIYPNPTDDYMMITSPEPLKKITVINSKGELMASRVFGSSIRYEERLLLDLLLPGIYFVKTETATGSITSKLVVR